MISAVHFTSARTIYLMVKHPAPLIVLPPLGYSNLRHSSTFSVSSHCSVSRGKKEVFCAAAALEAGAEVVVA